MYMKHRSTDIHTMYNYITQTQRHTSNSLFVMLRALTKKFHTMTGEPKNATLPLHSSSILSNVWKISLLGWWMVMTMARPVSARACKLLRISREEAESRPVGIGGHRWRVSERGDNRGVLTTTASEIAALYVHYLQLVTPILDPLILIPLFLPEVGSSRNMMFGILSN